MEENCYIYRYRSLEKVHVFDEIENDYFYCSELSKLNDPVENKFNLIFEGDEIDFRGLLKYYIFCLMQTLFSIKVATDDDNDEIGYGLINKIANGNRFFYGFQNIPSHKETFPEILDIIFNQKGYSKISKCLEDASKIKQLKLNDIIFLFQMIYVDILNCILYVLEKKRCGTLKSGVIDSDEFKKQLNKTTICDNVCKVIENLPKVEKWSDSFSIKLSNIIKQQHLFLDETNKTIRLKKDILFNKFTEIFFNNLYKICLGEKFVCCFSEDCENQLMWSHYANSDTGICFKYKAKKANENQYSVNLRIANGGSSHKNQNGEIETEKYYTTSEYKITKIEYTEKLLEIDFFANIGAMSNYDIGKFFYDENKKKYGDKVGMYSEENIKKYWNIADIVALKKLKEWAYEKELRFVQHWQFLIDNKVYYDFSQLEGIILGEKISFENKSKIISIIIEKCKKYNRKEFKIYQRKWSFDENKMIMVEV